MANSITAGYFEELYRSSSPLSVKGNPVLQVLAFEQTLNCLNSLNQKQS